MGLDMYLTGDKFRARWAKEYKAKMIDGFELESERLRIGSWRKHPDLHGLVVNTFAGGRDDCREIEIRLAGVEKLLSLIEADQYCAGTTGFFFGAS